LAQTKYARRRRANHLFRRYGITLDDYEQMFNMQQGRCAICLTDKPGGGNRMFQVDHDHSTGVVRGLLCSRCNQLLGYAQDDAEILAKAAQYLSVSLRRKHSLKRISKQKE
jgi:hypothetical protein